MGRPDPQLSIHAKHVGGQKTKSDKIYEKTKHFSKFQ